MTIFSAIIMGRMGTVISLDQGLLNSSKGTLRTLINLATPTNVVAPAPYFDLRSPQTHHVLVACHDHPLQIFQALPSPTDPSVNDTANDMAVQIALPYNPAALKRQEMDKSDLYAAKLADDGTSWVVNPASSSGVMSLMGSLDGEYRLLGSYW